MKTAQSSIIQIGHKGFTLVELLVVIAIITILATVGFTIFSGIQKNARDSRRQSDIDAMAKAMETKFVPTTGLYPAMDAAYFSNGVIPVDTSTAKYCVSVSNVAGTAAPVPPSAGEVATWASQPCPNTGYSVVASGVPAAGSPANLYGWRFCARLESGVAYCRASSQ